MKGWVAPHRGLSAACVSFAFACLIILTSAPSSAWGNGGRSADPTIPDYGGHDWIAERAARLLPENESSFIFDNLARYLYGSEMPDFVFQDTRDHHVYFRPDGTVFEDNSAIKARDAHAALVEALRTDDPPLAAERAGILTHYIADLAVFGHVLSSKTVWGEEKHHADFEDDADTAMKSLESAFFTVGSGGSLQNASAYDAAVEMARATTFGDGTRNARWLDDHYTSGLTTWTPDFKSRIEALISLAVNSIAEVLHSAALESNYSAPSLRDPGSWPRPTGEQLLFAGILIALLLALFASVTLRQRARR